MFDLNSQQITNRASGNSGGIVCFEVFKCLAVAGALATLFLTSAWIRNDIRSTQYSLEDLKRTNQEIRENNRLLGVEYESLTTPAVIEAEASRLGLISANDNRILIMQGHNRETANQLAQTTQSESRVRAE